MTSTKNDQVWRWTIFFLCMWKENNQKGDQEERTAKVCVCNGHLERKSERNRCQEEQKEEEIGAKNWRGSLYSKARKELMCVCVCVRLGIKERSIVVHTLISHSPFSSRMSSFCARTWWQVLHMLRWPRTEAVVFAVLLRPATVNIHSSE